MDRSNFNRPYIYFGIVFIVFVLLSFIPGLEAKTIEVQLNHIYYIINYKVIVYALSVLFGALAIFGWFISVLVGKGPNKL